MVHDGVRWYSRRLLVLMDQEAKVTAVCSPPSSRKAGARGGVLPVLLADISCWVCPIALRSAQGKFSGKRMRHSRVSLSDLRGICQCFCSRWKGGTIEKNFLVLFRTCLLCFAFALIGVE